MAEPQATFPTPSDFVQRVVFWVAAFCLAYSIIIIAVLIVYMTVYGGDYLGLPMGRNWRQAALGLRLIYLVSTGVLLTGAIALLRHRKWGALLLVIWALIQVCGRFLLSVIYLVDYSRAYAASVATTRSFPGMSRAMMIFGTMTNWAEGCFFPMLVCLILLQKEVRQLWARRGGGFEVIPLARANPEKEAEFADEG